MAPISMGTQHSSSLEVRSFLSGKLKAMVLLQKKCEEYFTEACTVKKIIAILKNSPEVHTIILAH